MSQYHFGEGPERHGTLYNTMEMEVSVVGMDVFDMFCRVKSGQKKCAPVTKDPLMDQKVGDTDSTGTVGSQEATLISSHRPNLGNLLL